MVDLDKIRLAEIPPSGRQPPDEGLTRILQAPRMLTAKPSEGNMHFACELHMRNQHV